jgi:tetratricopeptide (TPR) repeat protein
MKKIIVIKLILISLTLGLMCSCMKETLPQTNYVTSEQVIESSESLVYFEVGLDGWRNNYNTLNRSSVSHWDFGYPALMIQRDIMGQDMAYNGVYNQWGQWYGVGIALGPDYTVTQFPWRWYYQWLINANSVVSLVPNPDEAANKALWTLGKAHFYRAFAYFDLGRLYLSGSYANNPQGLTVPVVTEQTTDEEKVNNPRVPAVELYELIISDLGKAETYLQDAPNNDVSTPTLSAVYGLFARVYLEIGEWAKAEEYAKKAQAGFSPLTQAQWLDRKNGFNSPDNNKSWMFCSTTVKENDVVQSGIINWTSHMSAEQSFGYNGPGGTDYMYIDKHLYDLIGDTDFRKKSYIKPGATVDDIESDSPYKSSLVSRTYASIKFRPGSGDFDNYEVGAAASVPLMRVEEMMLIEAEAAARQNVDRGKQLLVDFVTTYRDPSYTSTSTTLDMVLYDIWIQRRIELWGEGFATFDIKRLNRGITRSYTGTNHRVGFRFNTDTQPSWMNYCIVRTEFNNNFGIKAEENNPAPSTPPDSPPAW